MKLSRNWLDKFLRTTYKDEDISKILTTIGLEVEGMEIVESVEGSLQGVVTGLVLTCAKHPDADKLSVTTVDVGGETPLDIVCGAPNVAAGQKVVVATVGTKLYTEKGELEIKKAKIRGAVSEGMICAEDELGLGNDHSGIIILPEDTKIGIAAAELFDITKDSIFEIGLTPNRSDATSQFGVAKDIYAYHRAHVGNDLILNEPSSSLFHINNTGKKADIVIENQQACPRYCGLIIDQVKIGQSPKWLQNALHSLGVKSINAVVDTTNYILHELGQPLHAFDYDKIGGGKVRVMNVAEGTEFEGLDGRLFKLRSNDLMICDAEGKPMCIAGVFGGKTSGISEETTTVFLECAYFDPSTIRATNMHHNLRTDAAKVYEKGADPNITILAIRRAAQLICEITGGVVSSEILDVYPKKINPVEVRLRYDKVSKTIGQKIPVDTIHNILNAMDMEITPVDDGSIKVKVPTNKADVTREIDLIEEILRIFGFDEVETPKTVKSTLNYTDYPNKNHVKNKLGDRLAALGFNEMMGLSLVPSEQVKSMIKVDEAALVHINNTSNISLDVMRPDMLTSGLISVSHNINRRVLDLKLFEFGKTYQSQKGNHEEKEYITLFMSGAYSVKSWNQAENPCDFFSLKAATIGMLSCLGITSFQTKVLDDDRFLYGLEIHKGPRSLVKIGEVHPRVLKHMGIKQKVYYAECSLADWLNALKTTSVTTSEISKYPVVQRDLALVIDKKTTFEQIEQVIKKSLKEVVKEIALFDIYENEDVIGLGKKSYAVSLALSSIDKTLEDKDIDPAMSHLIMQLDKTLGAQVRK